MAQGKDKKTPKAGADSKIEKNTQSDVSNEKSNSIEKSSSIEKSAAPTKTADQKTAKATAEIEKLEAELKAQAALAEASDKSKSSSKSKPSNKETNKSSSARPDVKPSTGSGSGSGSTRNASSRVPANKTKKAFSWLAFFAFLFSLVAMSGVAYLWWQAQQFTQVQQKDLEQTKTLAEQSYQQTRSSLQNVQDNLAQL